MREKAKGGTGVFSESKVVSGMAVQKWGGFCTRDYFYEILWAVV